MGERTPKFDLVKHYGERLMPIWRKAPFVLRITEWKDFTGSVLVIKERLEASNGKTPTEQTSLIPPTFSARSKLVERGHMAGEPQRRCLPVFRKIIGRVTDDGGIPLELQRYMTQEGLKLQVTLPLDDEAGAKMGLIFRLQERVIDLDRVELIARRVALFTREEAAYWLSRTTSFGADANRWAISGLRIVLGGQPQDPGVERMLQQLREA